LLEPLTAREQEILAMLAERLSAKEMAQRLVISDRTVKRHCANIYQKLGVNSRRDAVAKAVSLGVLQTYDRARPGASH
jgi:LuxR family maltose regulon positive regulatory protein